ncbi:hypothetical protein [Cryobacterium sp. 10I5]|uniref:hypothetical protein n=1 Tax=Cryobacterium sp. 10I5 TaxID=3048581 RepID=UPI002B22A0A0|nr:hypothetical protein [Cryobacterium sp. 10I5]MEB0265072.1 hypothetical protein [Cryobacterium sp. 10I5]
MKVPPEVLPPAPALSASLQLSSSGMKVAGGGVLAAALLVCVVTGVIPWGDALAVLSLFHP